MADGDAEMSRHAFSVAYDSREKADVHSIDVQDLAPALLAFGRLIREANTEFNEKRATAKVLVRSDFEHKCFHINFEVIIYLTHARYLLLWLQQEVSSHGKEYSRSFPRRDRRPQAS